jgi:hypothetical protein
MKNRDGEPAVFHFGSGDPAHDFAAIPLDKVSSVRSGQFTAFAGAESLYLLGPVERVLSDPI